MKSVDEDPVPAPAASLGSGSAGLFVASVGKAFRVLETFTAAKSELSLTQVAERSGIGRSAAQRFLYTLTSLGYLNQDAHSRQYRLSSKLLVLTQAYASTDLLRQKASAILEEANRQCEETINLTVLDGTEVVYILRFPSKHAVSVNLTVGTRLPAFCTAPGRAILAHLDKDDAEAVLAASRLSKLTDATEVRRDRLRRILLGVRLRGYALSNQEAFVGDISVAAPVFDERRRAIAAVNIAVPFPRWSVGQVQRKLTPFVKDVAERVTGVLSG
jgi:IclR family transcriptional regulator, pca regulon regulatory protein